MNPPTATRRLLPVAVLIVALAACSSAPAASVIATPTPPASVAASAAASLAAPSASVPVTTAGSPICDPWLSPQAIIDTLGQAPTKIVGYNFLNVGTPADCKWSFADGSYLGLFALEQPAYGSPSDYIGADGTRAGGVDYVEGLGIVALYDAQPGHAFSLDWFPDEILQFQLATEPTGAAQIISKEQLITLAHLVTRPSPLPVPSAGS